MILENYDWPRITRDLDERGCAVLERLLSAEQCQELSKLYPEDARFRSRVVMSRHGFGRGEYKYFSYPLPEIIAELRTSLYAQLAPIANRWNEAMKIDARYPANHAEFLARCHDAGQTRPTPLLLHTPRTTTTASTRTSTANMPSRYRSPSCSRSQRAISPEENSSSPNNARACSPARMWYR